jgi:two-component system, sensor histidine kinase
MDIAMPEMDGLEATRRIREKWPNDLLPPIVALTAHVADAIQGEAKLVGMDRIISKPIPFNELQAALSAALCAHQPDNPMKDTSASPVDTRTTEDSDVGFFPSGVAKSHLELLSIEELQDLAGKFVPTVARGSKSSSKQTDTVSK